MAKCRLLYQENEDLGRMISSGRLAKLEGELALQRNFSEEMKKSQSGTIFYIILHLVSNLGMFFQFKFCKMNGELFLLIILFIKQKIYNLMSHFYFVLLELDEFLLELDEDVEGMQSTIYFLQQQLRQSREQLATVQK